MESDITYMFAISPVSRDEIKKNSDPIINEKKTPKYTPLLSRLLLIITRLRANIILVISAYVCANIET